MTPDTVTNPRRPDLASLTGVRSSKGTFYPQYRGAAERLERVVHALDAISRALVRTMEGPEAVVRAVVDAAAEHLSADWVLFALAEGSLPDAGPRELVLGPDRRERAVSPQLPALVRRHLDGARTGELSEHDHDHGAGPDELDHHVHVPVELDGGVVGAFVAWTPQHRVIDATDHSVLRILASQTAVALQNSALIERGQVLLERSELAVDDARRHAADLALRNTELQATQRQLGVAHRRQVLDSERHRIARELHDSVTQCVLSAGMQIEICRTEVSSPELAERLGAAKDLTRRAVEQLRSAIYALNHDSDTRHSSLAELLEQLTAVHMPDELRVALRVEGTPADLSADTEHALLRIAGEALFNTAVHARASRAVVRLAYRPREVVLSVADDGDGDPEVLRTHLHLAAAADLDGRHRGLVNMQTRARELGGRLDVRRARLGGVRVTARVPIGDDA